MSIPFLNTRAVIEDYGKGKIGEIIFDNYGYTKNKEFFIIHPEKLAYEIGRDLCDNNNNLNSVIFLLFLLVQLLHLYLNQILLF